MTKEYCEAATEVLAILDHCEEKAVKLIPEKFISYLRENAEKDYITALGGNSGRRYAAGSFAGRRAIRRGYFPSDD